MRNSVSPTSASGNSGLPLLLLAIWGFLAFMFFLLFSIPDPTTGYPEWYSWGTAVFELVAFFTASLLCFRNGFSPQIASSRSVWLCLGLGMGFYFVGNIFFIFWESVLKRSADVSPGDLFYIVTYLCLAMAMGLAIFNRRLSLEPVQWAIVAIMTAVGVLIAAKLQLDTPAVTKANVLVEPTKVELLAEVSQGDLLAQAAPAKPAPTLKAAPKKPATPVPTKAPVKAAPVEAEIPAPAWVTAIEESLQPLKPVLSLFYVAMDLILLVGSTILLLAFWGGKFAQSWRMIAAATFCLYIADVWFKYATDHIEGYQSGSFLEVGWVLCGVLFGVAALLEYSVSQARRNTSRRRA
ncbi:MAG: hypothetical protein HC860_08125 [Alkalinema sp. RU_4_3]|nr:hypothetical protein [Alkalinema sp. RU_4_3]